MKNGSDHSSRTRLRPHRRRRIAVRGLTLTLGLGAQMALADPTGGVIVGGSGSIGGAPGAQVITQHSPRLAIEWQAFSLARGERTEFRQPAASAVALNRVIGGQPSEIHGQIVANGQVFLVNPNGVLFGPSAQVDVGGLVASTLDLSSEDFMAGRANFAAVDEGDARVVNEGRISAADGGYVALLGRQVRNSGHIDATHGTVALAAGEQVSLRFDAHSLVDVSVDRATLDALVENRGVIHADGGTVLLTAHARDALLDTVVNNDGVIEADSVGSVAGVIRLGGGDEGVVTSSGVIAARGDDADERGGSVELLGERIALTASATIDASGAAGGGSVHVGGSQQGEGPLPNSKDVFVGANARIDASARERGDGGRVVVYADESARIHGRLAATGGALGGDGGFVETSGKRALDVSATPEVTATFGDPGLWLIDPFNIDIVASTNQCTGLTNCVSGPDWTSNATGAVISANLITAALNAGQNVTITTGSGGTADGNITLLGTPVIAKSAGAADVTLTLIAHNDIGITAPIARSGAASVGRLNVVLTADSDANGLGNVALRAAVTTGGGTVTATGQTITVLGNVTTTGSAGRSGGDIALTAGPGGTLNITGGAINASGGSSTGAGTAGGNVALSGGRVIARAVTANGGNAGGANQAGGRAGTITIDATGATPAVTLSGNLTARGGNGTGSGAGGAGGAVIALDPIGLGTAVTVNTAGGTGGVTGTGGDVSLADVSSGTNARRAFTVNAGTGRLVTGELGGTTPLAAVNLSAAGGVSTGNITTLGRPNEAGFPVTISAGATGTVEVGDITTRGTTTTGIGRAGGAVALSGNQVAAGVIDTTGSNAVIASAGGAGGAVTLSAAGPDPRITLAHDILANGGNGVSNAGGASGAVTINGPMTLTNDVAITSRPGQGTAPGAAGAINFGATTTVDSDATPRSLDLDGRGAINLLGAIGQGAALANLGLVANAPVGLPAIRVLGDLDLATNGAVSTTGALRIGGSTRVDAGGGSIVLDDPANDFIGPVSVEAAGPVRLNDANALVLGPSSSGGDYTATANGDLRIATGAAIASTNGDVVLAARGGNFINDGGAAAITSPNGRWLVYATSPAGNVPNGLLPGNARPNLYNRTIDSAPPATIEPGNHFVFAFQPTLAVNIDPAGKVFGDPDPAAFDFTAAGLLAGDALADAFSGTPARTPGETAGNYLIDAAATSAIGYAVDVTAAPFTIARRPITLTADPAGKVFGDVDPALGFTVTTGTLVALPEGTLAGDLQRAPGETVGTYAITQGTLANPNYAIDFVAGDFGITPRPLTLAATSASRVYGDADPALGFVVQAGTLVATPDGALSGAPARAPGEDVGRYEIGQGTLTNPNYSLSFVPGNFDITPRPLSLAATAVAKTFGDPDPALDFTVTSGSLAALPGGALTGSLTRAPGETVGNYAITQGTLGNPNYALSFTPASLDVLPRPVSLSATGRKFYGDPDPVFDVVVTAGSLASIPDGALSGAPTRAPGETVGGYALSRGTLDNPNYVLTFTPGSFDIIPRPLRVQALDATRAAGAANPPFNVSFDGFAFGEDAGVLGGTLALTTPADPASLPGAYAITPSGLTGANYALVFIDGLLTVFDPTPPTLVTPAPPLSPLEAPVTGGAGSEEAIVAARQNRPGLPPIADLARLEIIESGIRLPPDLP